MASHQRHRPRAAKVGDWVLWRRGIGPGERPEKLARVLQVWLPPRGLRGAGTYLVLTADSPTARPESIFTFEVIAVGAAPLELLAQS